MYNNYAQVIDNEIKAVNVKRGGIFKGKRLGKLSPDTTYATMDLYPIIGERPAITDTEKVAGPSYEWDAESETVLKIYVVSEIEETDLFEALKTELNGKINALFALETATIKGNVMQAEVDSFPTQEKEALEYQADNTADVPLIAGLASVRGLTVDELAARVLAHASAYKDAIAQSMGKKHSFEDAVKNAVTLEDLKAIEIV